MGPPSRFTAAGSATTAAVRAPGAPLVPFPAAGSDRFAQAGRDGRDRSDRFDRRDRFDHRRDRDRFAFSVSFFDSFSSPFFFTPGLIPYTLPLVPYSYPVIPYCYPTFPYSSTFNYCSTPISCYYPTFGAPWWYYRRSCTPYYNHFFLSQYCAPTAFYSTPSWSYTYLDNGYAGTDYGSGVTSIVGDYGADTAPAASYSGSYPMYVESPSLGERGAPVEAPAGPTIYRASTVGGVLEWSDTAASIADDLLSASTADRTNQAARFLGQTVRGGWEATYDSDRQAGGVREIICIATGQTASGAHPIIVVQVPSTDQPFRVGQRLTVTGRLIEMSVDDPSAPGGRLVLEQGAVRP
jgi:hypothetical protein